MLDQSLNFARKLIPIAVFAALQRPYHWTLSFLAALWYRFPSRHINVIAVTGTKGKSSTVELINAILEKAGRATALSNTIRFKVGASSERNLYKMSMPGRFAMQRLIRRAVDAGCTHMTIEMTSQGALLYRHRFIELDTLVFTNLSPEHIEAHGSYEAYVDAKLSIARTMARSSKRPRTIIANSDDKESPRFLACTAERKLTYSLADAGAYRLETPGIELSIGGRAVHSPLSGLFNLYNILAAVACAKNEGVPTADIIAAIERFGDIPGRVQKIDGGQPFSVIVDYAHTADSLEKLYKVFRPDPRAPRSQKLTGVLGGTGGGRDAWKRREMGRLADLYCDRVILTDEDPYDEDPRKIVADVAAGITSKKPEILMDRRDAIRQAIAGARSGDIVLITGKGTDPYIMGPNGTKTPWSDAAVVREELDRAHYSAE